MAAVILFWNTKMAAVSHVKTLYTFPNLVLRFSLLCLFCLSVREANRREPRNEVDTFPIFRISTYPWRGDLLDSVSLSCAQKVSKDE